MLQLLKKLFEPKPKIKDETEYNKELIEKIYTTIYYEDLENIIFNPVNKLYLLNVYHGTFDDLLNNIFNKNSDRSIISVNVFSYFKTKDDIIYKLKKIIPILRDNKINVQVDYELNEILDSINFLKSIEEENG